MGISSQPHLQPQGVLSGSPEFGPHTPQLFTEVSPDKRINFRRFLGIVAGEVEVDYCTDEDRVNADPEKILGNLLISASDPRRSRDTDPEQLIVVGRDVELPEYRGEEAEETFYYPGSTGVVFDEIDFQKVARAPGDLAKAMKAQNRAQNQAKGQAPDTEEQLELNIEEKGFTAIRAAIHTLDQYIVGMEDLSSALAYRRHELSRISRYLSFPVYAHHAGRVVHKLWGQTDAQIHQLADLSALNAPPKIYGLSGMHRAIRNNLYNAGSELHPADSLDNYIRKLVKPYMRAKYEKVRTASRVAATVRNRHMEMLPASMQGRVIGDCPDAYEPSIVPRMFEQVVDSGKTD